MATLYVAEYRALGETHGGTAQLAQQPPLAVQTLTPGTEADTAALNTNTRIVELKASGGPVHFLFGTLDSTGAATNPAATTSSMRLDDGDRVFYGVSGGVVMSYIAGT